MTADRSADKPAPDLEARALDRFRDGGDPDAFDQLMRLHMDQVRGVIYNITLDPTDTDDICQETFLRAFIHFGSYRGHAKFATWLCRIAINTARTHQGRNSRLAPLDPVVMAQVENPEKSRPDHALMNTELKQQMTRAMAALPMEFRAVLVMAVIENMETSDVATACGCAQATVYWRLHKARRLLAAAMRRVRDE
jgi:RNA polymerase sigma-70 factor (ECF subfamily)